MSWIDPLLDNTGSRSRQDETARSCFRWFFPQGYQAGTRWLGNKSVREICAVSNCISEGPEDWIAHWKHNELGFYDTERLADEVIGEEIIKFDIYAYKLFPLRCDGDKVEDVLINCRHDSFAPDYEFLGYDIVTKSASDFFECSPLSCNHGATAYEVNEFCLVADRERAFATLLEISKAGSYEPGPYYLFEVYRKRNRPNIPWRTSKTNGKIKRQYDTARSTTIYKDSTLHGSASLVNVGSVSR
jgi:hypothetical protein